MLATLVCILAGLAPLAADRPAGSQPSEATGRPAPRAEGYWGIWYQQQPPHPEQRFNLSGGLATYSSRHMPVACYAEKAKKTFFVFGAAGNTPEPSSGPESGQPEPTTASSQGGRQTLRVMVSYFDHQTRQVPRPAVVREDASGDAHDNAAISLDDAGHLWVFVAGRETNPPAAIFKSTKPYDIASFQEVRQTDFAFPQPWFLSRQGFLLVCTRTVQGKPTPYVATSPDGMKWAEPRLLADPATGWDTVSGQFGSKIGVALTCHLPDGGPDTPTNLYYVETKDFGKTWQNMQKQPVELPIKREDEKARLREYQRSGRLVFLKDLAFDSFGNPTVLYILTRQKEARLDRPTCLWNTSRWTGREWETTGTIRSDNAYDSGCLHIEKSTWRLIAPTMPGPLPYDAGGDMIMWVSDDQGRSLRLQLLTRREQSNHNFARRPVNARDDFFVFWTDGSTVEPSPCRLYCADKIGNTYLLPERMTQDLEQPKLIWETTAPQPQPEPAEPAASTPAN